MAVLQGPPLEASRERLLMVEHPGEDGGDGWPGVEEAVGDLDA